MNTSSNTAQQIDPRGPRFGAGITTALLLVTIALGLQALLADDLATRLAQPAFLLLAVLTLLFAWGTFAGIARHPYGLIFKALVRPRLGAPEFMEATAPPTFAQFIGLLVSLTGVVLHILGVPWGLVGAASVAFVAAFLNAVFGLCLGCEMYALLVRAKLIKPSA